MYLHLKSRGCYSTDGIRANGLYHAVELLSLNVCHSHACSIFGFGFSDTSQPLQKVDEHQLKSHNTNFGH